MPINMRIIKGFAEPLIPALILIILAAPVIPAYDTPLFDETWYVPAARRFLDSRVYERVEHPPLGQLLISTGIRLLGDNPRGWRTPSLVFAAASLILTYYVAEELSKRRIIALTSSMLLASEKLFFTFSTIGVLDIFFIAFSLLSIYMALRGRLTSSALALAMGLCCKLTAALFSPLTLLILLIDRGRSKGSKTSWRRRTLAAAKWLILTAASFLVFLYLFDGLYS
ncbi:MAG: glycosyltransferase family 39 protein, partial [Candidatus Bathyarchaeia archaeon]